MSDATGAPEFIPAIVLLNQGVPITVYDLDHETNQVVMDGDEPKTKTLHLRFTNRAVAELEDAFDGLRASVPIVETTPVVVDGEALVGPAGPVVSQKVTGHEERVFYGLEAFQQAMTLYPIRTATKAMSIALGKPEEDLDRLLIVGKAPEYQNAVSIAWSIAQGVDPTDAAKMLAQASAGLAAVKARMVAELETMMEKASDATTVSPGPTGSPDGSD